MSRSGVFFTPIPIPSPLIFSIYQYWVPIRYLVLTNIFLDNIAALRKEVPAFLNSFIYFVETKYILSYGSFLFCICYSNISQPPSLCWQVSLWRCRQGENGAWSYDTQACQPWAFIETLWIQIGWDRKRVYKRKKLVREQNCLFIPHNAAVKRLSKKKRHWKAHTNTNALFLFSLCTVSLLFSFSSFRNTLWSLWT